MSGKCSCKQTVGESLHIHGIMLLIDDMALTSDIQASGRVTAPIMCMHFISVHSISEYIMKTLEMFKYEKFYCIHNLLTLSQEISILHLLIKERALTFLKNNFQSCAYLKSCEKILSLSVGIL